MSRKRNHAPKYKKSHFSFFLLIFLLLIFGITTVAFAYARKNPSQEEVDSSFTITVQNKSISAPTNAASNDLQESQEQTQSQEPEISPEEEYYQEVKSLASQNCTGDLPNVTDPSTWNESGKALMERLSTENGYDVSVRDGFPYLIAVNRAASTVTVYTTDDDGKYTVPYIAMVCSGGTDTPIGFWDTPVSYQWRLLSGPCYGQYATRIYSSYLFHSVPYYTQHKDDLEYDEFNKLGTLASLGCIRLMVVDVKWIFDNCPIGTPVIIYDDENNIGPMGKPGTIYIDPDDETLRGWDPTDPDPENPWDDKYLTGTTIRSEEGWAEYNAAQEDGRWTQSINETDLQGWSTDSKKVGTRG